MTAVEYLIEQVEEQIKKSAHNKLGTNRTGDYRIGLRKAIDFCEKAKEMEKQQIIDAANWNGFFDNSKPGTLTGEQYYNETFKQATL